MIRDKALIGVGFRAIARDDLRESFEKAKTLRMGSIGRGISQAFDKTSVVKRCDFQGEVGLLRIHGAVE